MSAGPNGCFHCRPTSRNAVRVLDDRERAAGRKRLQLKVNDGCGARGHRAEAGLDVVVETVRLVDDAKLLHFDSSTSAS